MKTPVQFFFCKGILLHVIFPGEKGKRISAYEKLYPDNNPILDFGHFPTRYCCGFVWLFPQVCAKPNNTLVI